MFRKLASVQVSQYIQTAIEVMAVLVAVAWFAVVGFVLVRGAYELGGLFVLFTLLVAWLAYANERPE